MDRAPSLGSPDGALCGVMSGGVLGMGERTVPRRPKQGEANRSWWGGYADNAHHHGSMWARIALSQTNIPTEQVGVRMRKSPHLHIDGRRTTFGHIICYVEHGSPLCEA